MTQYPIQYNKELPKGTFFNTTGLKGDKLKEKKLKANSLAKEVLHLFAFSPQVELTAWHVYDKIQGSRPITSVRRAISDLVKSRFLVYTGNKIPAGPYNDECKTVKLNPKAL